MELSSVYKKYTCSKIINRYPGMTSVDQLQRLSDHQLLSIPYFGRKALEKLRNIQLDTVKKCSCVNVEIGSYTNQIWVHAPVHMLKENGYCLDRCIAEEVMRLWMMGIKTTGCCCGHNKVQPYIGVEESDVTKMILMGYKRIDDLNFEPKSIGPNKDRE